MSSTDPETFSWCPFAGRSNDLKYARCYNANEEHTPRIFTVQGLCEHVLNIHKDRYGEFAKNIGHYIELNRCTANGVRIVPGTAAPLNTDHIQSELEKFERGRYSEFTRNTGHHTELERCTANDVRIVPGTATPHNTAHIQSELKEFEGEVLTCGEAQPAVDRNADEDSRNDDVLIEHIRLSLVNAPAWAGTLQDLCSVLSDRMDNTLGHHNFRFLDTLHSLCEGLTRIKTSLEQDHIRCFVRTSRVDFDKRIIVLQKEIYGRFDPVYEEKIEALLLQTQKDAVFRMENEEESRTMREAVRVVNRIQKLLRDTPIWAGTLQDLRSKITARRDSIKPPKNMGKWLTRNKLMVNHLNIRFFIPAYNDYNASVVILQRKEDGEFRSINELHEVIKAQIAGTFDFNASPAPIQRKEVETPQEYENPLKTTEQRIQLVVDRIQQLLEDTPILAGSPTEIHHKLRYKVQGKLFPKAVGSTGWMLNRCKERLLQKGIRLSRVYPRDSKSRSGQLVVLQKSVDGKFKSNNDLYDEFLFPPSAHTTTGNTVRTDTTTGNTVRTDTTTGITVRTGVEALPKLVRDKMENDFKEGVPVKDIVHMIECRTNMRGVTGYRIHKYMLWHNSPRPPIIRTDINELPKTVRDVIENDFKDGVPEEAIPRRVNYITEGEFRITGTMITRYMERQNIAKPNDVRTVVWNPNTATYTDWGVLIVNNIRQLLQDTATWTGTVTHLHPIIRCKVNGEFIPRTPTVLHSALKRVAQRLLGEGILYERSSRPTPPHIRLKRLTDAEYKQLEGREEPIEIDMPTPAVEQDMDMLEANVIVNRIHEILKDMPTWAGTLQDLHSKITGLIGNRGKFGITYTPHSLGESMIKIKPYLDHAHIRFFRAPYEDFNTLIIILQREVDGEFEPVSKKSVKRILNGTARNDICFVDEPDETIIATHEDKLLVNRIQGVLGNTTLWAGTMQELHSKLSETLSSVLLLPPIECAFMKTPRELNDRITRIEPRLESANIRFLIMPHKHDFDISPVLLQRKEDGEYRTIEQTDGGEYRSTWNKPDDTKTAQAVVCTDLYALPETMRTSLEEDFKRGVSAKDIRRRICDQTNGEFRITEHRIKQHMRDHNITSPPDSETWAWSSDTTRYVNWGDHIIDNIERLLVDRRAWTGTATELHSKISCEVEGEIFPKQADAVDRVLNSIEKRLISRGLYYMGYVGELDHQTIIGVHREVNKGLHIIPEIGTDYVGYVIDNMRRLLEDSPEWTGTATQLHSKISREVNGELCPKTPNTLGRILNDNGERIVRAGIRVSRKANLITLQKTGEKELCDDTEMPARDDLVRRNLVHPDPNHAADTTCETAIDTTPPEDPLGTADELPEIIDTTPTEQSIEVIGLSAIKQSRIEIPEDVLNRIGVKEGGRIIYLDDGENIIIKPAKYTA